MQAQADDKWQSGTTNVEDGGGNAVNEIGDADANAIENSKVRGNPKSAVILVEVGLVLQ